MTRPVSMRSGSGRSMGAATRRDERVDRLFHFDSEEWIDGLRGRGAARDDKIAALRELLLRAARRELRRLRGAGTGISLGELDELADHSADAAVTAVLAKLDDYRGASRFTTWAYKFAVLEAGVAARRSAWRERELPVEPGSTSLAALRDRAAHEAAEGRELLRIVTAAIERDLTPHQREILLAVAVEGVPIDVLAERFNTTRGALYKTVHDARRKLRAQLAAQGYEGGQG